MADLPAQADVIIVGAGPAGLSAAHELRRLGVSRVLVLDRDPLAGGVPRLCGHSLYGLREFRRPMWGATYADALAKRATEAGAQIQTGVTVTELRPGPRVAVTSDAGADQLSARLVLLATGIRETTRAGRLIGGTKPGGVVTTGALQSLVYRAGMRPFRRPIVLGTELVAFSALLTCIHAGMRPVAMVEPGARITARQPSGLLPWLLNVPIRFGTRLRSIEGRERVEGVLLDTPDGSVRLETDGVIVTGKFRPEATIARLRGLTVDPATGGPEVDEFGRTSDPDVFAAGNVLRAVETAGWCWSEGRSVASAMVRALNGNLPALATRRIAIEQNDVAYVVPQRLCGGGAPALTTLQVRAARATAGRLSLRIDGHELAGRSISALPERRLSLPLPRATGAPSVALDAAP